MSWIPATIVFVIFALALSLGLSEWLVRRREGRSGGDRDSLT